MKNHRIAITETGRKTGRWFDVSKAEKFSEETYWDGSNHISKVTGSQWEHEALYLTNGGVFILNHWSQYQGTTESFEIISKDEAAEWFVINEYSDNMIPDIFKETIKGLEVV
ncbi:MAG: hypothetical protein RBS07_16950 [Lentimicrobium sp.]|jgi:hypothetical protein|nr:hypothetical protein [Lentimicrobium sp.]